LAALVAAVASACSCQEASESRLVSVASPAAAVPEPTAFEPAARTLTIALSEGVAGTRPGRHARDPALEPAAFPLKLGEFEIDRWPYPNDPQAPPFLGTSREEASRLCGEAGGRLCTELEWERACRGPQDAPFATGDVWKTDCRAECESGFGVRGQGRHPEWTASVFGTASTRAGEVVVRGPVTAEPTADERRCARRNVASDASKKLVAFRCCRGAPNAARVPEPTDGEVFVKKPMDGPRILKLLESHPRTADLAKDIVLFGEPEAINTVLSRGPGDRKGFDFTTSPLLWRPVVGARFLVLAAKSGKKTSFVLVYHEVSDDQYDLASSFIMHDEEGPIVLAYSASIRPRLHFSDCWGCPGETGKVLFREPDQAVALQP
jgi:hypothetical protein